MKKLSPAKRLVKELPRIAKVKQSKRFTERNLYLFEREVEDDYEDKISDHSSVDLEMARSRLAVIEIPYNYVGDLVAYEFGMDMLAYNALCHRERKTKLVEAEKQQKQNLFLTLKHRSELIQTKEIREIEKIMSIKTAESSYWW